MKLFKKIIYKIWDIFKLPRFSQVPKVKIPKCKIPEVVPTEEYKKHMNDYLKNVNFDNVKIYVNNKEVSKECN